MNKKLAICIPTFQRLPALRRLLEQLFELQKIYDFDIYVSDNASRDGTFEYLCSLEKSDQFIWVSNSENLGIDRNMEAVMRMGKARYIWPLADDRILNESFFKNLHAYLENANDDLLMVERMDPALPMREKDEIITDAKEAFKRLWGSTNFSLLVYSSAVIEHADFPRFHDTFHAYVAIVWEYLAHKQQAEGSVKVRLKACPIVINQEEIPSSWKQYSNQVIYSGIPKMMQTMTNYYEPLSSVYYQYFINAELDWTNLSTRLFHSPVPESEIAKLTQYLNAEQVCKFRRFASYPKFLNLALIIYRKLIRRAPPSGFMARNKATYKVK